MAALLREFLSKGQKYHENWRGKGLKIRTCNVNLSLILWLSPGKDRIARFKSAMPLLQFVTLLWNCPCSSTCSPRQMLQAERSLITPHSKQSLLANARGRAMQQRDWQVSHKLIFLVTKENCQKYELYSITCQIV